ncbi:MAG: SixA phosphatase family protein [Gammaproteobacteria bacterium]
MQLLLVRHAIAADRVEFAQGGQPDSQRPLVEKGVRRMTKGAAALYRMVPDLSLLASSPLVRAVATADLIAQAYGKRGVTPQRMEMDLLAPDVPVEELAAWVLARPDDSCSALVGHEPGLSILLSRLTCGGGLGWFRFKKGGAVLLERQESGAMQLVWALAPRQLRSLGVGGEV